MLFGVQTVHTQSQGQGNDVRKYRIEQIVQIKHGDGSIHIGTSGLIKDLGSGFNVNVQGASDETGG